MSPIYYIQKCPTCGRRLQIRIEHLGKVVVCHHCHSSLLAQDGDYDNDHSFSTPGSYTQDAKEEMVGYLD